ncbi:uncharacterized protein M6G45_010145 isoform 2-T2 [Spheniscus humboldti]
MVFTGLHFSERAVTFEDHAWLTSPRAPESLNQHVRLQTPSRGGALPPAVTWPWRGEVPFCSALAFICKACSCKCRVFTNAGIARSLELCPSTKEALKQETRCHGMFQASSTRLNQIIAVSALAASSWKKQQSAIAITPSAFGNGKTVKLWLGKAFHCLCLVKNCKTGEGWVTPHS